MASSSKDKSSASSKASKAMRGMPHLHDFKSYLEFREALEKYMDELKAEHARLNTVAAPLSKEAKRARLNSYGRESYCSDRAKVDMIKKIKEQGLR